MSRFHPSWLFTLGCTVLLTSAAQPVTYHVDPQAGSDSNSGRSRLYPWRHAPGDRSASSQAATAIPRPGDRIVIKGGSVYTNMVVTHYSGSPSGDIAFVSGHLLAPPWGAGRAVFDGQYLSENDFTSSRRAMWTANESKHLRFEGFDVRNIRHSNGNNFGAIAILRGASSGHNTVRDCLVHDVDTSGILANGMMYASDGVAGDVTIENCVIYRCRWHGIMSFGAVANLRIIGNTINDNGMAMGDGIYLGDSGGLAFPSNVLIRGNAIHNHPSKGAIIIIPATDVVIENNVLGGTNKFGVAISPSGYAPHPSARRLTLRNNVMDMDTHLEGVVRIVAFYPSGSVDGVDIHNNTIVRGTGTPYGGVITLSAKHESVIANVSVVNNLIVTRGDAKLPLLYTASRNSCQAFCSERNQFHAGGFSDPLFVWHGTRMGFAAWQLHGLDTGSFVGAPSLRNGRYLSAEVKGVDLSAKGFSVDHDGRDRPAGEWSIGAFQHRPAPDP